MENKISVYGQIYYTKDYDLFKNIDTNRVLDQSNRMRLYKSFKQEQLIIPILVNEKMEIIDGQHRASICKELNLPIYYYIVKGYSSKQLALAQIGTSWKNKDYLHRYVEEGIEDYVWFNNIINNNDISINNVQKIISIINNEKITKTRYDFMNGNMILNEESRNNINKFIDSLNDFNFFEYYLQGSFVFAFLELYFYESYNHERMKNNLKYRKSCLEKQTGKDKYLELLTSKIYNFKAKKGENIFYNSNQKAFYIG